MAIVIDPALLIAVAGQNTPLVAPLAEWMNRTCPSFGIDSPQEYCHFIAQACHETDHFRTLLEYASGSAMEGRMDLGNTQPGDGPRFKGRGIFQTTGRSNYLRLGIRAGRRDMFLRNPTLLEQPRYAVWSACIFWDDKQLNDAANHCDSDQLQKKHRNQVISVSPVEYISITINGGRNGLEQRMALYERARSLLR